MKAAKNPRNNHIVYVSQMYSPAVTNRRNKGMKARKQLRNDKKPISGIRQFSSYPYGEETWGDNIFSRFTVLDESSDLLEVFLFKVLMSGTGI